MLPQRLDDRLHERKRLAEQGPTGRHLRAGLRESLQDALLRLRTEPGQGSKPLRLRGKSQLFEVGNAELLPELSRRLRPEPGHVHDVDEPRRDPLAELGERLQIPGLGELHDLALDRGADPGKLPGLSVERELRHGKRRFPDPLRGAPVGEQAERVRPVELEQVGEQLERIGKLTVPRESPGHARDDMPMLAVCLPTYNERENLEPMVRALGKAFADHGLDGRVLVIDDDSPDGTGALADRLAEELPFVSVLHRPRKEGLGPAYLAGFRQALADGADLVLEMDCDFSHDPQDVPRLVAAAGRADLVLGSRYVEGGGTRNWGLVRRAISRFGCFYAQIAARSEAARPDGRLQVLPSRRARADSSSSGSRRRAMRSRSRRPTGPCGPAFASSRCRSCSSNARSADRR